jgi:hypothetical protein
MKLKVDAKIHYFGATKNLLVVTLEALRSLFCLSQNYARLSAT